MMDSKPVSGATNSPVPMTQAVSMDTTISTGSTHSLSNDDDGVPSKKKRKRRPAGLFKCDHESCDKVFTRAEHLSRHKLNHNPTVIYNCSWEGCTKSFVRSDLKERHVKRHEARKLKDEAKALAAAANKGKSKRRKPRAKPVAKPSLKPEFFTSASSALSHPQSSPSIPHHKITTISNPQTILTQPHPKKVSINSLDSIILPDVKDGDPVNIHNYDDSTHVSAASGEVNALRDGSITGDVTLLPRNHVFLTPPASGPETSRPSLNPVLSFQQNQTQNSTNSPSSLISWLFDENQARNEFNNLDTVPHLNSGNFFNAEDDPFGLSSNLLDDILTIPPNFPNPAQQTLITPDIIQSLVDLIPQIKNHNYISKIDHFLELYWNCFHVQYPILHKPSFNTFTCPPILLLSMIMTGASYATSEPNVKYETNPREFADLIAEPLRFIIFKSRDFQPPCKVWIIQSLLLLECYERLSTNRTLHERAFIHHGTTIQLLRRSPGLGGNLHKTPSQQNDTIWEKWIDFEMLKRAALFAFFIDASHSMVFGYQILLSPQQIQLNLPCEDELWESYLTPKEIPNRNDSLSFLTGLKRLLNREHVSTSRFGKKILLSGLLTIMFQMQQRDLQGSFMEFDQLRGSWKDTLSLAFDYWNCDIMNGCCNSNSHATIDNSIDKNAEMTPLTLREVDTRCKAPVYHMAQITLRIQHYDYYIYSGAPWRMNVKADASDYDFVQKRIKEWSSSLNGRISVVYGYMFLFEMFLSPQDSEQDFNYVDYDANSEAIYNRLNVLALVTLVIWAFNYSLDGAESDILTLQDESTASLVPKEDGFVYLRRIRAEFTKATGELIHIANSQQDSVKYNNLIKFIATVSLPKIQNRHYMTGFLMMISKIFEDSYWEVGNEFSRLVAHVCKRSFGSQKIRCENMYKISADQ